MPASILVSPAQFGQIVVISRVVLRAEEQNVALVDIQTFFNDLARVSGEAILPFFRTQIGIVNKAGTSGFDPVTEADKAAEVAIRSLIGSTFPAHGILGEEFGADHLDADYVWVIDPIDGTRAFMTGMLGWGTLIGLRHHGEPVMGLMHQPFTGEVFFGDCGQAVWKARGQQRQLHTRACPDLSAAVMMTTSPHLFSAGERAVYDEIEAKVQLFRYGGDCYAYCMLAAGHIDLVIESGLQPYDIEPLIPIITGAGGIVTDWQGNPASSGRVLACGDRRLHAQMLERLRNVA